ncbi:hypothetical protein NDU88_008272 [Pleurodeles waltl]|uniref:Uncharacterized protein n=1 Tax=Pleurodeles waltl TaxID=8319 RepID=A0AAV7N4H2_PLEWA|nr:hypothetical protein NDU88_008272 [Pleurodeles waltl]
MCGWSASVLQSCETALGGLDRVIATAGAAVGVACWSRATLELRHTSRVALRVPLWGNSGSGSTSAPAGTLRKTAREDLRKEVEAGKTVKHSGVRGRGSPPRSLERLGHGREKTSWRLKRGSEFGEANGEPVLCKGNKKQKRSATMKLKVKNKVTPSLRSYFSIKPRITAPSPSWAEVNQDKQAMGDLSLRVMVDEVEAGDNNRDSVAVERDELQPPLVNISCIGGSNMSDGDAPLLQWNSKEVAPLLESTPQSTGSHDQTTVGLRLLPSPVLL